MTAAAPATTSAAPTRGRSAAALAGTGTLLRFALRRDRVRLPLWLLALWLTTASSLSSLATSYPEPADRAELARTVDTPAMLALTGPDHYLRDYNLGSLTAHQLLAYLAVAAGVMSALTVVRHTRAEEETGRAELLRSLTVGRHAQLTAALLLALLANAAFAVLTAATLAGSGLVGSGLAGVTVDGALLCAVASVAPAVVLAAVAGVTAQVTPFSRGASGLALAVLGVAFVLRAAGDAGAEALSWLSFVGWAQRTYPFVDDRWWPLLLALALALVATAAAYALSTRRDLGSGLRPPRPGRATASPALAGPFGLAFRLQRGVLVGFGVGLALLGATYGVVLGDAADLLDDSPELSRAVARLGGDLTESFAAVVLSFLGIVASTFAVLAVGRARAEETGGRAEAVLATGVSRRRWVGGHVAVSLAGGTVVTVLAGLGLGAAGAVSADDAGLVARLTGASLAYAPALWLTTGVAVALYGWLPRYTAAAWVVPAHAFLAVYLGELLDLPDVLADLSPYGHVPQVPAADLGWPPLCAMTALAAALVWLGLAGLARRDLDLP